LESRQALLGGLLEPLHGLFGLLVHAVALQVHEAEAVLGQGQPLSRSGAHPLDRLLGFPHHAQAVLAHDGDPVLGVGMAGLGQGVERLHGLREVLGLEGRNAALEAHQVIVRKLHDPSGRSWVGQAASTHRPPRRLGSGTVHGAAMSPVR
jgi:hypothetical protein